MRLDKFLSNKDICTRKEARKFLKQNEILVNGNTISSVTHKLNEDDQVEIGDYLFYVNEFKYFIFNKPKNVVCANKDDIHETIFDLMAFEDFQSDLFTVGRLDKDTTGLIIITNDGKFAHQLMSPKQHVNKKYKVSLTSPINQVSIDRLEQGVIIEYDYHTMPAKVEIIDDTTIYLTISEGKYHQVKRMLAAVDNEVTDLGRVSIGNMTIPDDIKIGDYDAYTKQTLIDMIY